MVFAGRIRPFPTVRGGVAAGFFRLDRFRLAQYVWRHGVGFPNVGGLGRAGHNRWLGTVHAVQPTFTPESRHLFHFHHQPYCLGGNYSTHPLFITLMIVLCSAAILASGCATSHSSAMAWDYKSTYTYPEAVGDVVADLGKEGWSFVSMSAASKSQADGITVVLLFKKHK